MQKLNPIPRELTELVSLDEVSNFVIFTEPEPVIDDGYNGEVDDCLAEIKDNAQTKMEEEIFILDEIDYYFHCSKCGANQSETCFCREED